MLLLPLLLLINQIAKTTEIGYMSNGNFISMNCDPFLISDPVLILNYLQLTHFYSHLHHWFYWTEILNRWNSCVLSEINMKSANYAMERKIWFEYPLLCFLLLTRPKRIIELKKKIPNRHSLLSRKSILNVFLQSFWWCKCNKTT